MRLKNEARGGGHANDGDVSAAAGTDSTNVGAVAVAEISECGKSDGFRLNVPEEQGNKETRSVMDDCSIHKVSGEQHDKEPSQSKDLSGVDLGKTL